MNRSTLIPLKYPIKPVCHLIHEYGEFANMLMVSVDSHNHWFCLNRDSIRFCAEQNAINLRASSVIKYWFNFSLLANFV